MIGTVPFVELDKSEELKVIEIKLREEKHMNPMNLLKMKQSLAQFTNQHPRFAMFIRDMFQERIREGTIIEISVQQPGEDKIVTNMKVQQSDLELFDELKNLKI